MVQKPQRERKFINCNCTRREKASCSSWVILLWAFVFSQLGLSSFLFINLSLVYRVVTKIWIGQHIFIQHAEEKSFKNWDNISRGKKNKSDNKRRWGKGASLTGFLQSQHFNLSIHFTENMFSYPCLVYTKIYKLEELLKCFHICNILNFQWTFYRKL